MGLLSLMLVWYMMNQVRYVVELPASFPPPPYTPPPSHSLILLSPPPSPSRPLPTLSLIYSFLCLLLSSLLFLLFISFPISSLISDHCFIHKWLLLTDPDDPSAGAKGYLKFSINVIGPGEDPTPSPSTMSQESVDIES